MSERDDWKEFENSNEKEHLTDEEAQQRIRKVFTQAFLSRLFEKREKHSEHILHSESAFQKFLRDLEKKLEKFPIQGALLANIPTLVDMLRCWMNGSYKAVSSMTPVSIVTALAYFILPIDLICDAIPGVGLLDDAALLSWCLKSISDDLQAFRIWRAAQDEANE